MPGKSDLTTEADIKFMVDSFYDKVNQDDLLEPVFNDVAKINWDHHLPRMYNFWNTILFSRGDYKGSPYQKHEVLPVFKDHFDRCSFYINLYFPFEYKLKDYQGYMFYWNKR